MALHHALRGSNTPFPDIDNLKSLWLLNEGSGLTASDYTGLRDGTLTSQNIWTTEGKISNGVKFDGSGYIILGTGTNLCGITGASFGFFAWVYADNNSDATLIDLGARHSKTDSKANVGIVVQVRSAGPLFTVRNNFKGGYNGERYGLWNTGLSLSATKQWHLIAGWRNGDIAKAYVWSQDGLISSDLSGIGTSDYDFNPSDSTPNRKHLLGAISPLKADDTIYQTTDGTIMNICGVVDGPIPFETLKALWNRGKGSEPNSI